MSILIQNALVITPRGPAELDILTEGGKIVTLGKRGMRIGARRVVDAAGLVAFPGFIDAHTHFQMNEGLLNETADSFATGTRAAVAGGTTTILDFATQERGGTLAQALETWRRRAEGTCFCDYGFHMAVTRWDGAVRAEMAAMTAAGVTSYKVYLAYDALRLGDGDICALLTEAKAQGALVSAHCENGDLVNFGVEKMKAAGVLSPAGHPRSRPAYVEGEAVNRFLAMARMADAPAYVVHLSTRCGLEAALSARRAGSEVYLETCPQYLLLNEDRYGLPGFEGAKYVCSPPLRAPEDSAALWEALARGDIDAVATDHCSFRFRGVKELGRHDFSAIPNGLPGVETRPALMLTRGPEHGLDYTALCRLMSENPAKLFGMYPQKGAIAEGSDADLVLWDPAARGTITASSQLQNVDYTPFEGIPVRGRARMVLLGGEVAAVDGKVVGGPVGRYVRRGPAQLYRQS